MTSLQKTVAWFNEELEKYIKKIQPPKVLHDSMQYSLLAGEKKSDPFTVRNPRSVSEKPIPWIAGSLCGRDGPYLFPHP